MIRCSSTYVYYFFMSASAALSKLDDGFPWQKPVARKAVVTAINDAAAMLRLRDVSGSPCLDEEVSNARALRLRQNASSNLPTTPPS